MNVLGKIVWRVAKCSRNIHFVDNKQVWNKYRLHTCEVCGIITALDKDRVWREASLPFKYK